MNIFTDLHHGDLYHSLHYLFEVRLGHELYRPIGMEWFHNGYWKIGDPYPNPANTAAQYLGYTKKESPLCLNEGRSEDDGIILVDQPKHGYKHRAITFEKFKSMEFDIIMPTFPGHDRPYELLRNKFQPRAKLIMQMGNYGQTTHLPNVLHSNTYTTPQPGQHCLFYHQEISPDYFQFTLPPEEGANIYSVVNTAPYLHLFNAYKQRISEANWKYYGYGSPDGVLSGSPGVSEKMKEAHVAWHLKPKGGVGHSTKGWFSIGRPLVTNMSQHRLAGGAALELFEPGTTCIDIEAGTVVENERQIRNLLRPDINRVWCKRVRRRFDDIINYDRDEMRVRKFLQNLR